MLYTVNFKYGSGIFSRSIAIAASVSIVRAHYESKGNEIVSIRRTDAADVEDDIARGVPVVPFYWRLTRAKTENGAPRKIQLFAPEMGWDFTRAIWMDEAGREFVRINGSPVSLAWARDRAIFSFEE